MSEARPLQFDPFVLDEANARLSRDAEVLPLPPKALAVLCLLARHAGQLVRKEALLDAVWGHRHVSDSVLKSTINQIRSVLGDDAAQPRYVETVPRHGYRFIGRLGGTADVASSTPIAPPADATSMVGRADALARLHAAWQRVGGGQRQLVWIEGDAGIGKTTLLDRFEAEIGATHVARGQCVEQFGSGEPYLPILEALESLVRRRPELTPMLRQVAPTWLVQMPWLLQEADRGALSDALAGAGPDRMLRELWELLERATQAGPLLLVTEDLHWSDRGTLRLMDHFARRRGSMRLLWVASFRLAQVIAEEHPLQRLRQELRLHRLCDELMLDPFSEREVAAYVGARLPGREVPAGFVRSLHAHTDGLPLFVVNVIDGLLRAGVGDWPAVAGEAGALPVPESLAGAIETQLAKLPAATQEVLEAASVCGMEFHAATVAEVLEREPDSVIDTCSELVRRGYWLREAGIASLPDGTIDARFAFRHAVYKHVFLQQLPAARRVQFHRRAARALERGRMRGMAATSAEIASHHVLGHEPVEALGHFRAAAESALGRFAPQEALQLTDQAWRLLPQCPQREQQLEFELALWATRGVAFGVMQGIAAPSTIEAFGRVTELCDELPPTPERALLLNSVGWGQFTRCEHEAALATVRRVQAVAARFDDPVLHVFGWNLAGVTLANLGRFQEACDAMHEGLAMCEREGDRLVVPQLYVEPQTSMYANIALPLAQLGLADQARAMVDAALARTARVGQPMARLVANWAGCLLGVRLDDVVLAERSTAALEHLVATTTIQQAIGPSLWFRGWLEIQRGRLEEGVALVREGYSLYQQVKTLAGCCETLSYAAEGLVRLGQWDAADATLDEADDIVVRFGERLWATELLLLRARVQAGRGDAAAARRLREAALAEAHGAQALGAELKAALALAAVADATAEDRERLRSVYARLSEGFETPLAREVRERLGTVAL